MGGLVVALVLSGLAVVSDGPRVTLARAQGASSASAVASDPAASADLEALRRRVAAFWAARVEGDTKGQWELLEPRGRGRLSPADYAPGAGPVKYIAYQVEDATFSGHFAAVRVRLLVRVTLPTPQARRSMRPSSAIVTDKWVRIGGIWYRSLEQESSEQGGGDPGLPSGG